MSPQVDMMERPVKIILTTRDPRWSRFAERLAITHKPETRGERKANGQSNVTERINIDEITIEAAPEDLKGLSR